MWEEIKREKHSKKEGRTARMRRCTAVQNAAIVNKKTTPKSRKLNLGLIFIINF